LQEQLLLLLGGTTATNTFLGKVPEFLPLAIGIGGASCVAEIAKNYIIPKDQGSQMTAALAKPALTAIASVGTMYLLSNGAEVDIPQLLALGAGSELAGDYAYNNFVSPYANKAAPK
jgi:hypothetical protein